MKRIDCIMPQRSQYRVLHHFTRKVGEALERLGYRVRWLEPEECTQLYDEELPDALLGFNGAPQDETGEFFHEKLGVPFHSLLVDPPYYYLELLASPLVHLYCDDACSLEYLESKGYMRGAFLTQGVEPDLAPGDKERDYEIVFQASFFDVERAEEEWGAFYSSDVCRLMRGAVDATLENEELTLWRALDEELQGKLCQIPDEEWRRLYYMMSYVQKGEARNRLLKSIRHLPVHVWDRRWKDYLGKDYPNITVHESVEYEEGLEILQRSKIVLCNSIRSVRGCNERVLNALACGAVPVTNANPYFREHFGDERDLLMYVSGAEDSVEEKIRGYLVNEEKRRSLAEVGRELVMRKHTWDARLREYFIS